MPQLLVDYSVDTPLYNYPQPKIFIAPAILSVQMHPIRVHWLRREGSGHTRVDGDVRCGVVRVMRSSMKAFRRGPSWN